MRLSAISKGLDWPSARIRVHQMAPFLARHGIELDVFPFPAGFAEGRSLRRELARADVVLVHKELPTFARGLWLRRLNRPLVFDFDDAVFLRKRLRKGTYASVHRMRRFRRMLSLYDGVIAGNAFLAEPCRDSGLPLLVAPSPVPTDVPLMGARAPGEVLRIGWVGLSTNFLYLRAMHGVLRELARRRDFRLVVISDRDFELEGVPVESVRWTLAGQERELARLDVGVMPLEPESPWSKGKCAYKLLQYMAAGVPVVATRVGMNVEVVEHGASGFLVESDAQWIAAFETLLDDAALRLRAGRVGRERVVREFSYPVVAASWAAYLERLAAGRGAPR